MSETARETAQRVVSRLLDGELHEFSNSEEHDSRPGGKKDPWRQSTSKVNFGKKDFSGKRSVTPPKKAEEGEPEKPARFKLKFQQEACGSKPCTPAKAWKQGKKASGTPVAKKPGKLSYRESLMAAVMERIKMKKAGKGTPVAKAPGSVAYKKEGLAVAEAKKGGMKGVNTARKMLGTIAKAPGAVKKK